MARIRIASQEVAGWLVTLDESDDPRAERDRYTVTLTDVLTDLNNPRCIASVADKSRAWQSYNAVCATLNGVFG